MDIRWIATISDGTTQIEKQGDYAVTDGDKKPWVRLVEKLNADGTFLTSLRILDNDSGRCIHMPRLRPKFGGYTPIYYSLEYSFEFKEHHTGESTSTEQVDYVWLVAHYPQFAVRLIVDMSNFMSWIEIVDKDTYTPLCSSPDISQGGF